MLCIVDGIKTLRMWVLSLLIWFWWVSQRCNHQTNIWKSYCILKHIKWSLCFAFAGVASATRSFLHFGSWAKSSQSSLSYTLILMNVQRQHRTFDTHQLFISTETVRGLMRCLVEEKSACMIVCGCIHRSSFQIPNFFYITISKTITSCILHKCVSRKRKQTNW